MKKLHAILSSACAAALMLTAAAHTRAAAPEVGTAAPDFSLPDSSGKTQTLAGYKGKFVVLEWTNPGCPFVKKHYGSGNMQKLQADATGKGVVWLTIDSSAPGNQGYLAGDDAAKAKDAQYKSATALLLDPEGKIGHLYGATSTPDMVIIDPAGKVLYVGAIDSINSTDQADIATATNYVQTGLEEALARKPLTHSRTQSYGCSVKYAQ